jgi:hypothetical protein
MAYDSTKNTLLHIKRVNYLLLRVSKDFLNRAACHDNSKLNEPEKSLFDEFTPKLAGCTYGSGEYKQYLSRLKVGLDHHYKYNSHHPEHYENGVDGMDLLDVLEMLMDWKAATERHNDGDIMKSISINEKRFNISPQLSQIFRNTITNMGLHPTCPSELPTAQECDATDDEQGTESREQK